MNQKLKISILALIVAAAAVTANAQTNLLQAVTVQFTSYNQGTPSTNDGAVQNIINKYSFGTKNLIDDLSVSGTNHSGDVLVRVTPVTNVVTESSNLVAVSTTNLVLTNVSSTATVSNVVIFDGATNAIGTNDITFGTNTETIGGVTIVVGTNIATLPATNLVIGTNTSVTLTTLTNSLGTNTGTNYVFTINAIDVTSSTNEYGTPYWAIYNNKVLTPISTNVYFDIHDDAVYTLTNTARIHGEVIEKNGQIKFGQTDEIRTLILSNSTTQVKMAGYAHGSTVPVSLGTTLSATVVYSSDYNWTGSGSGVYGSTNVTPFVTEGAISESFFKLIK